MESKHIVVSDLQGQFDSINEVLDDYLFRLNITGKNALRFNLLAEEAVRLTKSIMDENDSVELWFDGNARISHICIQSKCKMDPNKQEEFISLSSKHTNDADRTFFDDLKETIVKPKVATWSLAGYEAMLTVKRREDKYSQEAWDNLERSVLANLADDISVGVKGNNVLIIITKDFTESIESISAKKAKLHTERIYFNNDSGFISSALNSVESGLPALELGKKDELHVKLLFEETIGMVKEISGDFAAIIWAERYKRQCAIRLILATRMDIDKKTEFLKASSNRKNAAVNGFMDKIRDIIETGVLSYEDVSRLQQKYNGGMINYGAMGTYLDSGVGANPTYIGGVNWSLGDYRDSLQKQMVTEYGQEAWDELERSIVASLSRDVIVGIKRDSVTMTIVYDVKEGN
ncbi:hypothetical protein SAMN02910298_01251 [Pseudobutyrivibrio sp. YE44]|uniref:hypothetical protein n=1 Tax=Pseudobutyrivibrio sp. YE44 TaxID=1520802 RepID=UPI00088A85DF|nr:hypothetical protein [Pseudobutyrivibrio sp. YE44]SDB24982.1 hypothetical protein SAMN02910298_01251 [Pseudobutyrivibrio sp. YE44]